MFKNTLVCSNMDGTRDIHLWLYFCFLNKFICIIFKITHIIDIIWHLSFSVWPPSLSMTISSSIHVAANQCIFCHPRSPMPGQLWLLPFLPPPPLGYCPGLGILPLAGEAGACTVLPRLLPCHSRYLRCSSLPWPCPQHHLCESMLSHCHHHPSNFPKGKDIPNWMQSSQE